MLVGSVNKIHWCVNSLLTAWEHNGPYFDTQLCQHTNASYSATKKWQNMTHLCSRICKIWRICIHISNPASPTKNVFEVTLKLEHTRRGVQQNCGNFIRYTIQLASRANLFVRLFTLWLSLTFLKKIRGLEL